MDISSKLPVHNRCCVDEGDVRVKATDAEASARRMGTISSGNSLIV